MKNTETNEISEKYTKLAEDLIQKENELAYIRDSNIKIIFVRSTKIRKSKGRLVYGSCEKVAGKMKFLVNADFIIRVYEPNCPYFTDKQFQTLLFHEMLHISIEKNKDGNDKYSLLPHDIEEFNIIKERFGLDWSKPPMPLFDGVDDDEPKEETA